MTQANADQDAKLDVVKDEVKPFNEKLKRVLKGKPTKELAERLDISVQTIYGWKSRGHQPAAHQLPIVCEFGDCSLDYLCDNSIPVDADPTSGAKYPPPLADLETFELMSEVASRYTEVAAKLYRELRLVDSIVWENIARSICEKDLSGLNEKERERVGHAVKAIDLIDELTGFDPSAGHLVMPCLYSHRDIQSEDIAMSGLLNRWDRLTRSNPTLQLIANYIKTAERIKDYKSRGLQYRGIVPDELDLIKKSIQKLLD